MLGSPRNPDGTRNLFNVGQSHIVGLMELLGEAIVKVIAITLFEGAYLCNLVFQRRLPKRFCLLRYGSQVPRVGSKASTRISVYI